MKGKNNIWERWWLGLAYFSPVLPLYRNHPINLQHVSVDWFLYNANWPKLGFMMPFVDIVNLLLYLSVVNC